MFSGFSGPISMKKGGEDELNIHIRRTLKLLEIILFLFEFKTYFCYILGIG